MLELVASSIALIGDDNEWHGRSLQKEMGDEQDHGWPVGGEGERDEGGQDEGPDGLADPLQRDLGDPAGREEVHPAGGTGMTLPQARRDSGSPGACLIKSRCLFRGT